MQENLFYHIYNRANGNENLFVEEENYKFFLKQWDKYISSVADLYSYCMLPNHFHFLIKIKKMDELMGFFNFSKVQNFGKVKNEIEKKISKQFSNLFSSYTQSFNKVYQRKGSLFMKNFKRKEITSDIYLTTVISYIHRNPVHHGFVANLEVWQYSSYNLLLSNEKTKLKRKEVMDLFSGINGFIEFHKLHIEKLNNQNILEF